MTTSARNNHFNLELDRRSPIPVYIQISDAIRAGIQTGKLPPDSVLPPSEQICEELGITRMTLRQAYNVLAREGLVDAQRGRGTFVRRSRIERTLGQMVGFSEEMRAWGKKPSSNLLSFERTAPSEPAGEFLGVEQVYRIERLRLADDVPIALEEVQIPVQSCPDLEEFDLSRRSLYEILEGTYHLGLAHCEQIVSASLPSSRQRRLLEIGPNVALLQMTRRSFTKSDVPATYGITNYRGDLYTASVHGERRPPGGKR
ncbi:MAG TPA: GntR family transcriptional regulator [Bryobacteraceae bacterium]